MSVGMRITIDKYKNSLKETFYEWNLGIVVSCGV